MAGAPQFSDRLDTWKEIASYVGKDVRTVLRWEQQGGFPVHRIPVGLRRSVFAYRHEIDAWMAASTLRDNESATGEEAADADAEAAPGVESGALRNSPAPESRQPTPRKAVPASMPWWKVALYLAAGSAAAVLLTGLAWRAAVSGSWLSSPHLTNLRQLTFDGREKTGLETDGRQLYFGEHQNGWLALCAMGLDGGQIRVLWNPPMNVMPVDISPDGKALLAITFVEVELEKQIWVIPLNGNAPHRLGGFTAHSAAWSPDGQSIAFANGESIYLVNPDGTAPREVGSFSAEPGFLHWSQDGMRLRFDLLEAGTQKSSLWELDFAERTAESSFRVLPIHAALHVESTWSRAGRPDEYFYAEASDTDPTGVGIARYGRHWWEPRFTMRMLHSGLERVGAMSYLPSSDRLFVVSSQMPIGGIEEYDARSKQFRHILPGISAGYMDYSRDCKWIAWTGSGESSLWVSRADGSMAKQIASVRAMEQPRWSPDGKEIAFMGWEEHRPTRIYIVAREGGQVREASQGDDSQGAPTWSPDGRYLAYGNTFCQAPRTCAIHRIELSTGRVDTLPGSAELMTARWSPDGKSIAAIQPERHELMLFDVESQRWRKLADAMTGADLSWSADSKFLYTEIPGAAARIVKVSAVTGVVETALDLKLMDKFNLVTAHDSVFALAPNNDLVFAWGRPDVEIYSYNLVN